MKAEEIFRQYAPELKAVERELLSIFDSSAAVIPLIGKHIVDSGGKRIRPLFLLMSADLCGYHGETAVGITEHEECVRLDFLQNDIRLRDDISDGCGQA